MLSTTQSVKTVVQFSLTGGENNPDVVIVKSEVYSLIYMDICQAARGIVGIVGSSDFGA